MEAVIHSFAYCIEYLNLQIADLSDAQMVQQPLGQSNHPAWTVGHLTFSCQAIGNEIGLADWLPDYYQPRYGTGSIPRPNTDEYESKTVSLPILADSVDRIIAAIRAAEPDTFDQPLPDEGCRTILPTIRHALTQILVAHTAQHVGQITAWRRAMKLKVIDRPFL